MKKNVAVVKFGDLHFFITRASKLVVRYSDADKCVRINDGLHNNAGWHLTSSVNIDDVLQKLENAYNSLD